MNDLNTKKQDEIFAVTEAIPHESRTRHEDGRVSVTKTMQRDKDFMDIEIKGSLSLPVCLFNLVSYPWGCTFYVETELNALTAAYQCRNMKNHTVEISFKGARTPFIKPWLVEVKNKNFNKEILYKEYKLKEYRFCKDPVGKT